MQDAAEHLQTIRTLMERGALYRRALGPVFSVVGGLGVVGGAIGWWREISQPRAFAGWWLGVAAMSIASTLILIRRQAWQAGEPFWTPPARRIAEAVIPTFTAGLVATWLMARHETDSKLATAILVGVWHSTYGLALLSAGFFTPRGVRRLGFGFLTLGLAGALVLSEAAWLPSTPFEHLLMSGTFGLGHLLAALWLRVTGKAPPV